jgi:hypothetical protein
MLASNRAERKAFSPIRKDKQNKNARGRAEQAFVLHLRATIFFIVKLVVQ